VPVDDAALESFALLALGNRLAECQARVDGWLARGMAVPQLCLLVLAPTARRLGEMWEADRCSFVDVTTALGLMHALLRNLRDGFEPVLPPHDPGRRLLLASLAGDQHTFGLGMVAEFFRQAGWDVTLEIASTEAALGRLLARDWFGIVGLSLGSDDHVGALGLAIRAIRRHSRNPAVGVIVGGPVFLAQPELARLVGADLTTSDAEQAVVRAEGLRLLLGALAKAT
jgi:methanogenic corrinoid protein MtbC1